MSSQSSQKTPQNTSPRHSVAQAPQSSQKQKSQKQKGDDPKKRGYSAYVLTSASREALLKKHPPQFDKVIAHHVTYCFPDLNPPPPCTRVQVIGYATTTAHPTFNERSIECLVVRVLGTEVRPDEHLFHITVSLDPKTTRPVHSNHLLKDKGWVPIDHPFWLNVNPQWISF